MINIRLEQPADILGIRRVNLDAFPSLAEADLVDTLREQAAGHISMVAVHDNEVIGHIMFSPVAVAEAASNVKMIGLAPMAVLAEHQRTGVGTQLIERGLQVCKEEGFDAIVVLGHPTYYPRFGFLPAVHYGLKCTYDVPEEVFMVLELEPGSLEKTEGTVQYHSCFDEL